MQDHIEGLALVHRFGKLIADGDVRDYADLARLGHVTRARLSQIMDLLLLAPDIQARSCSCRRSRLGKTRLMSGSCGESCQRWIERNSDGCGQLDVRWAARARPGRCDRRALADDSWGRTWQADALPCKLVIWLISRRAWLRLSWVTPKPPTNCCRLSTTSCGGWPRREWLRNRPTTRCGDGPGARSLCPPGGSREGPGLGQPRTFLCRRRRSHA